MKTIKDQFAGYEIAKELKGLGFDEECLGAFNVSKHGAKISLLGHMVKVNPMKWDAPAPLWQQVIDYFREKYHIHINISYLGSSIWSNSLWYLQDDGTQETGVGDLGKVNYKTYEEARVAAILKAIELIKNK